MLRYKIDVLKALKNAGFTTTRLRKEKILGENSIQYIREGKMVGAVALDTICSILQRQPSYIIEWLPDENGVGDKTKSRARTRTKRKPDTEIETENKTP